MHHARPALAAPKSGSPWSIVRGVGREDCVSIEAIFYSRGERTQHTSSLSQWQGLESLPHARLPNIGLIQTIDITFVQFITRTFTYKCIKGHTCNSYNYSIVININRQY